MKYVVLGAAGQLGRDLCPRLPGDVVALTRADVDLTQPEALHATLLGHRPDVVVNCAAYNLVNEAEQALPAAFAVNAWSLRQLALTCRQLECVLLHVSSDYVFGLDESRTVPYTEEDAPGPVNVYGLSKLTGEYLVRALCPRHYVVRTCGLYGVWGSGGKGGNFVETMLRVAAQAKPLRVVADQVCTPTYTADLAQALVALMATGRHGLYHVTNGGSCSWHDFASAIFDLAEVTADLAPISSRERPADARRPAYSVLENRAFQALSLPPLRSWREALTRYLQERLRKAEHAKREPTG